MVWRAKCVVTGSGDGVSCPAGGRTVRSARGGWLPLEGAGSWAGGLGVLPSQWTHILERQGGMVAPPKTQGHALG